jgi:CheY-like chemotaxis protein
MKSNLLVVDDKPANIVVLGAILGASYDLIPAHSGYEALDLIQEKDVDVVLLDIEMPGIDGYETVRRIKQIERCKDIPIILVSGVFTEDPYVKKGYEYGAVDYFTKPFNPDVLKLKVAFYASMRQKEALIKEKEEKIKELEMQLQGSRVTDNK